jgi:hypothetical protein
MFAKYYWLKGLFRFGMGGFVTAYALSFQTFAKYAYLWERQRGGVIEHERQRVPLEG